MSGRAETERERDKKRMRSGLFFFSWASPSYSPTRKMRSVVLH